jgi:hypothetical protein
LLDNRGNYQRLYIPFAHPTPALPNPPAPPDVGPGAEPGDLDYRMISIPFFACQLPLIKKINASSY